MRILLGLTAAALALPVAVQAQPEGQLAPPAQQDFPANVPTTTPDSGSPSGTPETNMPSGPDAQAATPQGDSSAATQADTGKAGKHKKHDRQAQPR